MKFCAERIQWEAVADAVLRMQKEIRKRCGSSFADPEMKLGSSSGSCRVPKRMQWEVPSGCSEQPRADPGQFQATKITSAADAKEKLGSVPLLPLRIQLSD